MTSVIPVHSVLRAIALACCGSNPARRRTSRVTSVARSAASFRFSCSSSNCAAAECARSTVTRDSSSPCSWAHHGASGSTFTSISPQTCSATPSSRSSLLTLRPRGRAVSESVPTAAEAELATVDELAAELMR